VSFVSNNSFVDQLAHDGMRKHLLRDFNHIDLHGNVRRNPKLSGTTHNVFGIRVGVGITVAVRRCGVLPPAISYHRVPENWRKEEKLAWLSREAAVGRVPWETATLDDKRGWAIAQTVKEFESYVSIGNRASKAGKSAAPAAVFKTFSRGLETARDEWVYDFDPQTLTHKVKGLIQNYNAELDRWRRVGKPNDVDSFVTYDDTKIKWCSRLKDALRQEISAEFSSSKVRGCLYRPYETRLVFFDSVLNHRTGVFARAMPTVEAENENRIIGVTSPGSEKPFMTFVACSIMDLHLVGPGASTQCFPFYLYSEDGTNRRENITDWPLEHFREHYNDKEITTWDIFYYVYAVLHHPEYRAKYAENLKRELPRIPLVGKGGVLTPPEALTHPPLRVPPLPAREGQGVRGGSAAAGLKPRPSKVRRYDGDFRH
jgi:predicted helicase